MLTLAIISTILAGLDIMSSMADTGKAVSKSDHPGAALLGAIIGLAIKSTVIVTIWVFYNRLGG